MREEYNSVLSTPTEANIIDWPVLADTEKSYIFTTNISYWKTQQLASKNFVTLPKQTTSQALHFKNSFSGIHS